MEEERGDDLTLRGNEIEKKRGGRGHGQQTTAGREGEVENEAKFGGSHLIMIEFVSV